jgi:hypothetical protein
MVQVSVIVIYHKDYYAVIRTVPLLWHVQKLSVPCVAKVKATSTGKLLVSLSRNDTLCLTAVIPE